MGTMQSSGQISMADMRAAHGGGTGQISMADYYKGGSKVTATVGAVVSNSFGKGTGNNTDNYWSCGDDYTGSGADRQLLIYIGSDSGLERWDFGNTSSNDYEKDHGYIFTSTTAPNGTSNGYQNSGKVLSIKLFDLSLNEIPQRKIQTNLFSPYEGNDASNPWTTELGSSSALTLSTFTAGYTDYNYLSLSTIHYAGSEAQIGSKDIGMVEMVYVDHIDAYNPTNRTDLWYTGKIQWKRKGTAQASDNNSDYFAFEMRKQVATNTGIASSGALSMAGFYSSNYVNFPGAVSYAGSTTTAGVYHVGARPTGVSGGSIVGTTPDSTNGISVTVGSQDAPASFAQASEKSFANTTLCWYGHAPQIGSSSTLDAFRPAAGATTNWTQVGGVNAGGSVAHYAPYARVNPQNTTAGITKISFTDSAGVDWVIARGAFIAYSNSRSWYEIGFGDGSQDPTVEITTKGANYLEGGEFEVSSNGVSQSLPGEKVIIVGSSWTAAVSKDPYPA